ncbi:MAG TPA: VOC family protein [Thermoanaerobaculia bacterium]|nr:VOC family protein [Thermoanaerobaculia bacterium]
MERITPHLWFDKEAQEAAALYTSTFPDSRIKHTTTIHDTPSGTIDIVTIELAGQEFTLLNAGPLFKFTPAISFLVSCATREEVDAIWSKLAGGGHALLPLGSYPFSDHYGWTQDRYGLSWQVIYVGDQPIRQKITPVLMFTAGVAGKAEEAMQHYTSIFDDSRIRDIQRYPAGFDPEVEGTVQFASFELERQQFGAMDSARAHMFNFNEAISLMVYADDQQELDRYWDALSAVPAAEQCGWLKDKYGVSWQIVPRAMDEMLARGDDDANARVMQALLQMKKLDIAKLQAAAQ